MKRLIRLRELKGPPSDPTGIWRRDLPGPPVQQFRIEIEEDLGWMRREFERTLSSVTTRLVSHIWKLSPFYFRGQTQEYFRDELVWLAPSWLRRADLYPNLDVILANCADAVYQWTCLLDGFVPNSYLSKQLRYPSGRTLTLTGLAAAAEHPQVLALMQHYGFPTHFLDLSASLDVSLWFASHTFDRGSGQGQAKYVASEFPESYERWPTIYVFTSVDVIDFRQLHVKRKNAARPHAQQAAFLAGGSVEEEPTPSSRGDFFSVSFPPRGISENFIVCICKVPPKLIRAYVRLRRDDLFPPPDKDRLCALLRRWRPPAFIEYA